MLLITRLFRWLNCWTKWRTQGVVGAENLDLTRDEIAEIEDRFVPEPA
jgi:hypothetical protein